MARPPARRPATYEDLRQVPDHLRAELIDGELVVSPRPSVRHVRVASKMGVDLGGAFGRMGGGGPGGWVILDEPEVHLVGQVLIPDVAGWRRERWDELPDAAFIETSPDWVAEILSPSTVAIDRTRKMALYAQAQVRHVWLVDPVPQILEVYRLDGTAYRLVMSVAGRQEVHAEPFEAVALDLGQGWET